MDVPKVENSNGTKTPIIGMGTYLMTGSQCANAVRIAIDIGFRHIDTAFFYENEQSVGEAIRDKIADGTVKREDLFIVTKLWCHFHEPERVEEALRLSLTNLGLDYVDLYLMHWPYAYVYQGADIMMPRDKDGNVKLSDIDYLETWKVMETLVEKNLTRSLGVSNFNSEQLKRLMENCKVKPIHNQIEVHPYLNQKRLIDLCTSYGILVTAYCPLGRRNLETNEPHFLDDANIMKIAKKYGKTPAQVVLRFLVQSNCVPIPKSGSKEHLMENINIFDFELQPDEMLTINSYDKGERIIPMIHAKKSIYYPFNIPY